MKTENFKPTTWNVNVKTARPKLESDNRKMKQITENFKVESWPERKNVFKAHIPENWKSFHPSTRECS